jgi:hypothetical protein
MSSFKSVWYLVKDPKFDSEKPYYSNTPFDHPEARQTNLGSAPKQVKIADVRGYEYSFGLERDGFQVLKPKRGYLYHMIIFQTQPGSKKLVPCGGVVVEGSLRGRHDS